MAFLTSDQSPLAIEGSALYPTGTTGTIASNNAATVFSIPLGTLLAAGANTSQTQAALFDAKTATIVINNNGTAQSITAASLQFTDTVGSGNPTITYTIPNVSIANNITSTFVVHLSSGVLKTANLSITFGVAPVAGSANVQAVFHSTGVVAGGQTTTPIYTSQSDGAKASYVYAVSATAPYATPTDWIVIRGSSSKVIKIKRIEISGAATAATEVIFTLKKHTVANTAGTSTNPTPMLHDSNDSAASALVLLYSAAPTIDATATIWKTVRMTLAVAPAATTVSPDRYVYDYGAAPYEPMTLRGTAQELAINFASAAVPSGGVYDVAVTWSEE